MKIPCSDILIVDDDPEICSIISRWLQKEGHRTTVAFSGEEAVDVIVNQRFQLLIADMLMPGMSGMDLLTFVKSRFKSMAVIIITALDDLAAAAMTFDLGAYGYLFKPFEQRDLMLAVNNSLERRRLWVQAEEYRIGLERRIQQEEAALAQRETEITQLLVSALVVAKRQTQPHCVRVGEYASLMAVYLRWNAMDVEKLRLAARLHDVGKLGISEETLSKVAHSLATAEELRTYRTHPYLGARILQGSDLPIIEMARDVALAHHEHWDGSGYPSRLVGQNIPESARIVTIVDTYDTLTGPLPHRNAFSHIKALKIMEAYRDNLFDAKIYDYFVSLAPHMERIRQDHPD